MILGNGFKWILIRIRFYARHQDTGCPRLWQHSPRPIRTQQRGLQTSSITPKMDEVGLLDPRGPLMIENHKYVYTPLDTSPDSIRLLRLHPSRDSNSPIQCTLIPANLQNAPSYIALSYAWGSNASRQYSVQIEDGSLSITSSLKHALQRLRLEEGELLMWIDAICINQKDISERNVQTANMRAIYQNADSVAVWLGTQYNESREALKLARDVLSCSSSQEIQNLLAKREDDLISLVRLLRRQYWWRIWVVQEVTCGRRSTIYCGDDEIEWKALDRVCDIFKEHEVFLLKLFYKNHSYVRTLIAGGPKSLQLSRYSPGNTVPPLLELLTSHKGKKSTDPKDKVFALVGISSSRHTFGKIDYSNSMKEVYSHTARHIISNTNRLEVICLKQHDVPEYNLPSWAPNWTRAPSSTATLVGLHHREPPFKASGDTTATVAFLAAGDVLKVTGTVIDTVKDVSRRFLKKSSPSDPVPPLRAFLSWWKVFVQSRSDSLPDQAVFARAISCGNWDFDDEDGYATKLDAMFALSEELLSEEDTHISGPPSRVSTYPITRSTTMSESVTSLLDEEIDEDDVYSGEKEQVATILSASVTMNKRRLIISETGLVGLGLWNAEVGDLICVLLGCNFPVLLRKSGVHYVLVGEAYIDGIMNGEALQGLQDGRYGLESFEIH